MIIAVTAATVLVLCTAARWYLERSSRQPVEFWKGRVRIGTFYNTGGGFGLHQLKGYPLLFLSAMVLTALLAADRWLCRPVETGLLLGGGFSNFWERTRYKRVLDYLSFPKAPKCWRRFVYNLADLSIFLGAALLFLRPRRR